MVSLKSRLTGLSVAVTAVTLLTLGLALTSSGNAHAQSATVPQNTPVSCSHEANGVAGGPHYRGTQYVKAADNCANFWLISVTYAGYYTGYYLNQHGMWQAVNTVYCGGGVCNGLLISRVPPGIRLTVNSDGGGYPIRVGF